MKEMKKYMGNLRRMFRCLFNMNPHLFILVIAIAVFESMLPYVNIIATQMVIDGLIEQKNTRIIANIVIVTIVINVLFRLILGKWREKREVSQVELELSFQKKLSLHEMRLSMADTESTKVQELKRNIEQAKMRNGGIENVICDFEIIVKNISSFIVAGFVFSSIFVGQHISVFPIIILAIMVIIGTFITLKLQAKQNILVSELNDKANQANGSAFAYMQFISNYHFGKEIRIFNLGEYLCDFFERLWTSSIGYTIIQELGKARAKIPCITVLCNEILNIFVYILAIGEAYAKRITIGGVVVYINSVQSFIQSIVSVIGTSGEMMSTGVFLQPFLELLDMEEERVVSNTSAELPSSIKELSFDHIYFKYAYCVSHRPVLRS